MASLIDDDDFVSSTAPTPRVSSSPKPSSIGRRSVTEKLTVEDNEEPAQCEPKTPRKATEIEGGTEEAPISSKRRRTSATNSTAPSPHGAGNLSAAAPSTPLLDGGSSPMESIWESLRVAVGTSDACGMRAFMEDAHSVATMGPNTLARLESPKARTVSSIGIASPSSSSSLAQSSASTASQKSLSLFAVMDGHAGDRAAKFVAQRLPETIEECVAQMKWDVAAALSEAFRRTDDSLKHEANSSSLVKWKDGCTAVVVAMVDRDELFVANIGDCRAVLARESMVADAQMPETQSQDEVSATPEVVRTVSSAVHVAVAPVPLSRDHVASDPAERARIEAAGGFVTNGRVMGVMEVSRTFGDFRFKNSGVICDPEVTHHVVSIADKFIVVASDGLWKVMDNAAVVNFVRSSLRESNPASANAAAHALVQEALHRGSQDNVTVVLIVF